MGFARAKPYPTDLLRAQSEYAHADAGEAESLTDRRVGFSPPLRVRNVEEWWASHPTMASLRALRRDGFREHLFEHRRIDRLELLEIEATLSGCMRP